MCVVLLWVENQGVNVRVRGEGQSVIGVGLWFCFGSALVPRPRRVDLRGSRVSQLCFGSALVLLWFCFRSTT